MAAMVNKFTSAHKRKKWNATLSYFISNTITTEFHDDQRDSLISASLSWKLLAFLHKGNDKCFCTFEDYYNL